jgi:hypothetical protein
MNIRDVVSPDENAAITATTVSFRDILVCLIAEIIITLGSIYKNGYANKVDVENMKDNVLENSNCPAEKYNISIRITKYNIVKNMLVF